MLKLAVFILNFMVKFIAKFGLNLAIKQGFQILKFKAKESNLTPFTVKFKQAF
nr:hypothetical protein [uncultured Campylobacter sp.]